MDYEYKRVTTNCSVIDFGLINEWAMNGYELMCTESPNHNTIIYTFVRKIWGKIW